MADEINDPQELRRYLDRLALSLQAVRRRLKRFEDEFGMDSEQFAAKLRSAQLDARLEAVRAEWAGEYEMLQRLKAQQAALEKRLKELS
jgi:hypothetical protein